MSHRWRAKQTTATCRMLREGGLKWQPKDFNLVFPRKNHSSICRSSSCVWPREWSLSAVTGSTWSGAWHRDNHTHSHSHQFISLFCHMEFESLDFCSQDWNVRLQINWCFSPSSTSHSRQHGLCRHHSEHATSSQVDLTRPKTSGTL